MTPGARTQAAPRKRKGGRRALMILILALIALLAFWIYRHFYLTQFQAIPSLRSEANTSLQEDLLLGDTSKRALTRAEKREDMATVQEAIEALKGNRSLSAPLIDEHNEAQQAVIEAESDADFIRKLQAYIKAQDLPLHLVGTTEYSQLRANLGQGFFEENSPFALAVDNERSQDRYDRMGASPYKYSLPSLRFNEAQGYAILSNLNFSDGALPVAEKTIQAFFKSGTPQWRLIIDLRNTGGSSTVFWTEGLLPYFAHGTYSGQAAIYMMKGMEDESDRASQSLHLDTYADYLSVRESSPSFQLEEGRNKIRESGADRDLSPYDYRKKLQIKISNLGKPVTSKKVYLLVDETTTGQAATFADFCQANELAQVYGRKSGPEAWNLPNFLITLRHSGLIISGRFSQAMRMEDQEMKAIFVEPDHPLGGGDLLYSLLASWR